MPIAITGKFTEKFAAAMPDASVLWSDEPEMESSLHYQQLKLLVATLERLWRERRDYFIGANLTVYFSRAIEPTPQGWRWSGMLGLYLGVVERTLRYLTSAGELVPTPEEAEAAAQLRAARLAAKLRELGIDPESV